MAVAIFIGTVAGAWLVGPKEQRQRASLGLDFIAFYTAGTFVREGRSADLYDLRAVRQFERELAKRYDIPLGNSVGPWWNPPFYAWVFVPLSKLPYPAAVRVWIGINFACAAAAMVLLCGMLRGAMRRRDMMRNAIACPIGLPQCSTLGPSPLPSPLSTGERELIRIPSSRSRVENGQIPRCARDGGDRADDPSSDDARRAGAWQTYGLVPVLLVLSMPFIHAITHGQNTCTSLLIVTATVCLWRNRRPILAGLIAGLLLYKPQLAVVLAAVLVLDLGWRALIGLTVAGLLLLLATLALPGTLQSFVHQLPANLHHMQEQVPYVWERHVTFKAFWRVLLQGAGVGDTWPAVQVLTALSMAGVGSALACSIWKNLRRRTGLSEGIRRDRLIAATIAATPLLMPFYFDYDQVLLAIPAVLLAAEFLARDSAVAVSRADRWILRLWPAHFVWLMLNPEIAVLTRINLAVPLWTGIALLLIHRAAKGETSRIAADEVESARMAVAA